jgi:hypothetical protein
MVEPLDLASSNSEEQRLDNNKFGTLRQQKTLTQINAHLGQQLARFIFILFL